MQSRRITVGYKSRRTQVRLQTRDADGVLVKETRQPVYGACPMLRLSGDWLTEAGFHAGDIVRVEISRGQLIIHTEGGQS